MLVKTLLFESNEIDEISKEVIQEEISAYQMTTGVMIQSKTIIRPVNGSLVVSESSVFVQNATVADVINSEVENTEENI